MTGDACPFAFQKRFTSVLGWKLFWFNSGTSRCWFTFQNCIITRLEEPVIEQKTHCCGNRLSNGESVAVVGRGVKDGLYPLVLCGAEGIAELTRALLYSLQSIPGQF